jgi:hypothetical protein
MRCEELKNPNFAHKTHSTALFSTVLKRRQSHPTLQQQTMVRPAFTALPLLILVGSTLNYYCSDKQSIVLKTVPKISDETEPKINVSDIDDPRSDVLKTVPKITDETEPKINVSDIGDPQWWVPLVDQIAKPYQSSLDTSWCHPQTILTTTNSTKAQIKMHKQFERKQAKSKGLFMVKVPKAASSTVAAVSIQIAYSVGQRYNATAACAHHVHHGNQYKHRGESSFLWTTLREPAKRALSAYFFFRVSRRGITPNATGMINELKSSKNFQLKYIGRQKNGKLLYEPGNATTIQMTEMISGVRDMYQFIAITERMDESLVVLKLLYGFDDFAIVVLSSKKAGGFDDGLSGGTCHAIQKAFTTPEVDSYIESKFRGGNYDHFLYAVANRSLDLTIEALGRERVELEVQKLHRLHRVVKEQCSDEVIFPCTEDLAPFNRDSEGSCFFGDIGCGHLCVQETVQKYNAGTLLSP